jgi:hypothetical protein
MGIVEKGLENSAKMKNVFGTNLKNSINESSKYKMIWFIFCFYLSFCIQAILEE